MSIVGGIWTLTQGAPQRQKMFPDAIISQEHILITDAATGMKCFMSALVAAGKSVLLYKAALFIAIGSACGNRNWFSL